MKPEFRVQLGLYYVLERMVDAFFKKLNLLNKLKIILVELSKRYFEISFISYNFTWLNRKLLSLR